MSTREAEKHHRDWTQCHRIDVLEVWHSQVSDTAVSKRSCMKLEERDENGVNVSKSKIERRQGRKYQ